MNFTDENRSTHQTKHFPTSQLGLMIKNSVIRKVTTHSVESVENEEMLLTVKRRPVPMKLNYRKARRSPQHYQQLPLAETSPPPVSRGAEIP